MKSLRQPCPSGTLALVIALLAAPRPAAGRQLVRLEDAAVRPLAPFPAWQESAARSTPLVVAGIMGAVVGFFGGAFIGYNLERSYFPCGCDDPGLAGLIFGAAAGPAIAVPTAVHLANGGRGSFKRSLGASALIGGLGVLGLFATSSSGTGLLFLFGPPLVEIAASVAIERSSSARAPAR